MIIAILDTSMYEDGQVRLPVSATDVEEGVLTYDVLPFYFYKK